MADKMNRPSSTVRRLVVIFSADVAGYSRLMNADEAGTLRLLSSHREITDRLISHHGGRIANTAGDSILEEFASAVDALQCALGIQERIAAVNEEITEERRLNFRIGIHAGEVTVRNGDLFGDGVNIAARMQALAQAGSVCVSATAQQFVDRVLPIELEDLGLQTVKNIEAPVRAFLARVATGPAAAMLPPIHRVHEIYLVRRLFDILFGEVRQAEEAVGLAFLDAPVLVSVEDRPGINVSEISTWLALSPAKVRRIVRGLEKRGFVERLEDAGAGRAGGLILTVAGRDVRERLRPLAAAAQDRVMAPLSQREREEFQTLVGRLIKAHEARSPLT
jgi:adenylate cyclase